MICDVKVAASDGESAAQRGAGRTADTKIAAETTSSLDESPSSLGAVEQAPV
jgi:hypothetical protein